MKLLVGLGNPGREYDSTRHNVGFDVVDLVAESLGTGIKRKKFRSFFEIVKIGGNDVCILKPQTFMNLSGEAVSQFAGYYKVKDEDILVVQDDIDMPFTRIKFVSSSGSGGHNGIGSIIDHLGTNGFWRLKIGIGRPRNGTGAADHVLDRFDSSEMETVPVLLRTSAEAVKDFFCRGPVAAMQKYNNLTLVSS